MKAINILVEPKVGDFRWLEQPDGSKDLQRYEQIPQPVPIAKTTDGTEYYWPHPPKFDWVDIPTAKVGEL